MNETVPFLRPPVRPHPASRDADQAGLGSGVANAPDDELIATWQLFRKTAGAVDGRLAAALIADGQQPSIFYEALAALAAAPERKLPMSELAGTVGISSGGLTKLVDRMVHAGLVQRHHSTTDRRVVYAILTPAGTAHEHLTTPAYAAQLRADFDRLGPAGLAAIRRVCGQIQTALTAEDCAGNTAAPAAGTAHAQVPPPLQGRVAGSGRA